jgi:diguanylate cyclase (GGDEF)-like protein
VKRNQAHNTRLTFTVLLPPEHAERAAALEDAVRAAGFDLDRSRDASNDVDNGATATDELTSLLNRAAGLGRLQQFWALSVRHGEPISCLLISVDQIRAINEQHGVNAGDHVLRELARLLRAFARTEEHVCRLSGNEFLVICPKSTARAAAIGAERHRWAVQSSAVAWESGALHITVSVGVAERDETMTRVDELIAAAGEARTRARELGGDRVQVAGESKSSEECSLLRAIMDSPAVGTQKQADHVLILHEPGEDPSTFCAALSRWGYVPMTMPRSEFSPASPLRAGTTVIIAAVGQGGADWKPIVRSIRSVVRRIPILLLGEPAAEATSSALLEEGADAFVSTDDPPRVLQQMVHAMAQSHAYEHQLTDNQAMRAEQARMLTALFDLARAFASADTLERCLDRLTHIASEMLRAGRVAILVCNRDRSGMSLARVSDGSVAPEELSGTSIGAGLIGRACRERETILIADLEAHAHEMTEIERVLIIDAPAAVAPMVAAQHVVGALIACARPGHHSFKPWEIAMLDLLSNIAAASIDDYHARTARDEAREAIVVALAKLTQHRDGPTAEHVDRVARMCVALARELVRSVPDAFPEIDAAFISNLEWAVPLHDIGKVGLPDHILLKPGRLTDDEMEIMRSHVEIGQSALHSISARVPEAEYLRMAELIAYSHHEWYDGTGYPMGLKGEQIPLAARLASVADAYDAITSSRIYKEAVAHGAACEEISKRAGTQFDPRVVEAFMSCKDLFAVGVEPFDPAGRPDHADAA